jgi:integrase
LSGEQVQTLLKVAGRNRALLATAIMAGGLRVSELTHLQWWNLDLKAGVLRVPVSKTAAGHREIALEPEPLRLLREHKVAAKWSEPEDFIFASRVRDKARDRNSVRTKILYPAIERASEQLGPEVRSPFPEDITFHSLRRTYAAIRAELGEHPAVTAAQMGHRDPRMTLRVYTTSPG